MPRILEPRRKKDNSTSFLRNFIYPHTIYESLPSSSRVQMLVRNGPLVLCRVVALAPPLSKRLLGRILVPPRRRVALVELDQRIVDGVKRDALESLCGRQMQSRRALQSRHHSRPSTSAYLFQVLARLVDNVLDVPLPLHLEHHDVHGRNVLGVNLPHEGDALRGEPPVGKVVDCAAQTVSNETLGPSR